MVFKAEETQAQRGEVIYSQSHRQQERKTELDPRIGLIPKLIPSQLPCRCSLWRAFKIQLEMIKTKQNIRLKLKSKTLLSQNIWLLTTELLKLGKWD